jgi:hypothetical protein
VNETVLLVTCSAPDAMAYVLGLPSDEAERTVLVATGHVVRAAEERRVVAATHTIAALSSLGSVRQVLAEPSRKVAIVVGPDPWGPFKGKGFVRARLLAPWALAPKAHADLVELHGGGGVRRTSRGLGRAALLRKIYVREALLLAEYVARAGAARPAVLLESRAGRLRALLCALMNLPRAVVRTGVAVCMALVTLARVIPFVVGTEARARYGVTRP